jgi:hypothetical protein
VPALSQHFVDGQSVTLPAPVGKLLLMSHFEPRASRARLTGQGEARRLPDPPRSPAVWRIPPKWTNLIPALAGFLFSDSTALAHMTRRIRSVPVGATTVRHARSNLLPPWQARATCALVLYPATTGWISRPPRTRLAPLEQPLMTLVAGARLIRSRHASLSTVCLPRDSSIRHRFGHRVDLQRHGQGDRPAFRWREQLEIGKHATIAEIAAAAPDDQ